MVLFCQKMVEQYQKVKNLYSRENLLFSRLRCTPSTPSKGECFCLFPFCFLSDSRENQPDKSLISVIDNDCYVYPRARALCEKNGL